MESKTGVCFVAHVVFVVFLSMDRHKSCSIIYVVILLK